MPLYRRRPFQGLVAFLVALLGIGVRMALVRANGDPSLFPIASRSQAEFKRVNDAINGKPAAAASLSSGQRSDAGRIAPAAPQFEEPKVIEIEYDAQGNAIVGESETPAANSPAASAGKNNRASPANQRRAIATAGSNSHRNEKWHFEIGIPFGWQEMSSQELRQMNQGSSMLGFGQVKYQAGFRRRNTQPGTSPYILVSATPGKLSSYAEVEQALERELPQSIKKAEGALKSMAGNLSVDNASVDRATNRITFRSQMDVRGVGTIQALSVGHIGSRGVIFVHSYALAKEFNGFVASFQRFNDSFVFDEGYEFVEKGSQASGLDDLVASFPGGTWGIGALVGGGAGIVVGFAMLLFRKPSRRPSNIPSIECDEHAIDPTIANVSEQPDAAATEHAMQGTCFEHPNDLTPPRTLDVINRFFSWAIPMVVFGLVGWWVFRYGPEVRERWPEMKQAAASWWIEKMTGATPEEIMSDANAQMEQFRTK